MSLLTDIGVTFLDTFQVRTAAKMMSNYRVPMRDYMGSISSISPCVVCCGRNKYLNINHEHLSTAWYNKQCTIFGDMNPFCYMCNLFHPMDNMTRQKVIISDSTIHGVQYLQGWGWGEQTPVHCDMETIPGASLNTLKKAWERSYSGNPLPIDTVVVGGLSDIRIMVSTHMNRVDDMEEIAKLVANEFNDSLLNLHTMMKDHSKKYETNDTMSVMTVLQVPALYWHTHDGPYPTPDYVNMKQVFEKVNLTIEAFNLTYGSSSAPKLHQTATRGRKGRRVFMMDAFREKKKEEKMHLTDELMVDLTKRIIKHFEHGTPRALQLI